MAGSSEDGRRRSVADLRDAAIARRWGGCKQAASSSSSAQSVQSMAIVVANPEIVLQPTPLPTIVTPNPSSPVHMEPATPSPSSVPIASTMTNVSNESSSGFAKPMHNDATETDNPPTEAVTHLDAVPALPSPPPAEVHAATSSVPPPPLPGPQNPNGYTCKLCSACFPTHQGLGGHMAAHKTRELAAVPCLRDAKPVKEHGCRTCGAVFLTGYKLGGHMRKHYTGPKIVPKKKPRLDDVVTLQLLSPRTVEPASRSPVPGRVLLFGVDIGAEAWMPAAVQGEEEGSSTTAGQAPSEPTDGEQ